MDPATEIEIAQLRRAERAAQEHTDESDRLVATLLPHYACDFIVAFTPDFSWIALPPDWQHETRTYLLRHDILPKTHKGAVAVSLNTLRAMAREL